MGIWARPELWWRALIVVAAAGGLLTGDTRLAYYTTQSNLIVLGYFGAAVYWMVRRGSAEAAAPRLRGPVTLWILITGLVAHFLLTGGENPLPGLVGGDPATLLAEWSTFLVHYVVPVMVLADWLAFGPRRVSPWRDLPLWLIFPLGYAVVFLVRGALFPTVPVRYPYFFLDPSEGGYPGVALWILILGAGALALGALLLGFDRLRGRAGKGGHADGDGRGRGRRDEDGHAGEGRRGEDRRTDDEVPTAREQRSAATGA